MTRGELSPLAHARRDIEMYQAAAAKLLNWVVLKEGGVRRRSGTRFRGVVKYPDRNTRIVPFEYSAAESFALEMGDAYARFWTTSGPVLLSGSPYEIGTQYTQTEIDSLQWAQSGNTLYVAFRSMTKKPQKLVRISNTNWVWQTVVFRDGPYLPINDLNNSCTPSTPPVTGSSSTLTFTSLGGINDGAGFVATDIGRALRVQFDGKYSWGFITSVPSTTSVVVAWQDGQGGTTASITWRLGAFSDTTGYPGTVEIFDGRLIWGNTPSRPRYFGYSYAGTPERYAPSAVDGTVTDAHGGAYDLLTGDEILWLQDGPRLQIGTSSAVRSFGAADINAVFGPRNANAKLEIREGVSSVRPVTVGPSTVHCSKFSTTINDLFFDYQVNALVRPEVGSTAEHLFYGGVHSLTFQQLPFHRLWTVLNSGELACTTIDRYEKVVGFSRHNVGGVVVSGHSVPGATQDDLWLVVRRTINDVQVQYMETLDRDFIRANIADAYFVDCGATYSGVPTNSVPGIYWLPNTEVAVLADGKVLPRATVSGSGVLTLPNGLSASKISFGIPFRAEGALLRAPTSTPDGSTLGRRMKVVTVDVDVYETKGLKIVSDRGAVAALKETPGTRPTTDAGGLSTGSFRVLVDGSWTSEGQISFLADEPLPATIRAFNLDVEAE